MEGMQDITGIISASILVISIHSTLDADILGNKVALLYQWFEPDR